MISESPQNNIVLIGMPGCGKTTVGKLMAEEMKYRFIDTDYLITEITGKTPRQIVQESGRDNFMEIQDKAVLMLDKTKSIISTGGGMIYSLVAMNHLKSIGKIVFLNAPFVLIDERMDKTRKLSGTGETLMELYNKRVPLYKEYADLAVDCEFKPPEVLCQDIIEKLKTLE